jgi:hypothetical protein
MTRKYASLANSTFGGLESTSNSFERIFADERLFRELLDLKRKAGYYEAMGLINQSAVTDTLQQSARLHSLYSEQLIETSDAYKQARKILLTIDDFGPLSSKIKSAGAIGAANYESIAKAIEQAVGLGSPFSKQMAEVNRSLSLFGRDIQREFGLVKMQSVDFASLATSDAISGTAAGISRTLQDNLFKSGFLATAELAQVGRIGKGLASEILDHYDIQSGEVAQLFQQSVELVRFDDNDQLASGDDAVTKKLSQILEKLSDLISKSDKKDALGLNELLTFLTLILAIAIAYDQNGDSQQLIELGNREIEIERKSQEAREDERKFIRYVIGKTPLRIEAHREAQLMRYIFPDQWLRVIGAKGNWLFVEVYEYSTDKPIRGWVHRGNVRSSG